jgi:hypothetical protein
MISQVPLENIAFWIVIETMQENQAPILIQHVVNATGHQIRSLAAS